MLYNREFLFDSIVLRLQNAPCASLSDLSSQLRVSRRTLEYSIQSTTGKTFRDLRKGILLARVNSILASNPAIPVKELSFVVGFRSPSSFSRAIRNATGFAPAQLRARFKNPVESLPHS